MKQFEIWSANLESAYGSEPGKIRPVVIIQSDLLNGLDPKSTIICPISSNIVLESKLLRVHLPSHSCGLDEPSDILIDQIRAIDNKRIKKCLGMLPAQLIEILKSNLSIVLDLEN